MFSVNTAVINDTNEGSVPFRSNRVRVLALFVLAHWKGSAVLNGTEPSVVSLVTTVLILLFHA